MRKKLEPKIALQAGAAGLLNMLPIPMVDSFLADLARGAAMEKVAKRHNVVLSKEAKKVLGHSTGKITGNGKKTNVARELLLRTAAPIRAVTKLEGSFASLVEASLFNHYLDGRTSEETIDVAEAQRIRRAMDQVADELLEQSLADVVDHLGTAFSAGTEMQGEPNSSRFHEAWTRVSGFIEELPKTPHNVRKKLLERFEAALSEANDRKQ